MPHTTSSWPIPPLHCPFPFVPCSNALFASGAWHYNRIRAPRARSLIACPSHSSHTHLPRPLFFYWYQSPFGACRRLLFSAVRTRNKLSVCRRLPIPPACLLFSGPHPPFYLSATPHSMSPLEGQRRLLSRTHARQSAAFSERAHCDYQTALTGPHHRYPQLMTEPLP